MAEQLPLTFEFRACHRFEDFYPGSNREIVDQLMKFSSGSGEEFIFLYGNAGYGKTHLLHACCQHASENGLPSIYFDLAAPSSNEPDYLIGLENYPIVCIDNIDGLAGLEGWELALFNLFNELRDRQGKLLISAVAPPNALSFKLPDLRTRLNWGLSLKIQALDDDDKIAALIFKAKHKGFEIAPQTARYLLSQCDRSLPSLWKRLDELDAASLAAKRKLTIPFLKKVMQQT